MRFTDDVIDYRLAFLTKNQCPPTGLKPHSDTLKEFPYLGTPHQKTLSHLNESGFQAAERLSLSRRLDIRQG